LDRIVGDIEVGSRGVTLPRKISKIDKVPNLGSGRSQEGEPEE